MRTLSKMYESVMEELGPRVVSVPRVERRMEVLDWREEAGPISAGPRMVVVLRVSGSERVGKRAGGHAGEQASSSEPQRERDGEGEENKCETRRWIESRRG